MLHQHLVPRSNAFFFFTFGQGAQHRSELAITTPLSNLDTPHTPQRPTQGAFQHTSTNDRRDNPAEWTMKRQQNGRRNERRNQERHDRWNHRRKGHDNVHTVSSVSPWDFPVRRQRTCAGSPTRIAFHAQPISRNEQQEAEAVWVGVLCHGGLHSARGYACTSGRCM